MPKQPNSILIFAAGFGTRMGALTADRPKPLVPVSGKPMIDRAVAIARGAGISQITANLHYKHAMLAQHLAPQNIAISLEQPDILDTGGGLRHALPLIGYDPVFTLNPDAIWVGPNPLSMLAAAWNPVEMDALLMLIPPNLAAGHTGKGDFLINPDNRLMRGAGLVYSGAQIIKTELLDQIKETTFSLNVLWDIIEKKGGIFGVEYTGKWCDVGTPQGIRTAENLLGQNNV